MKVLCVAEKPSIAKSITEILSGGRWNTRDGRHPYIRNYDFDYNLPAPLGNGRGTEFTVTAVLGHLTSSDFDDDHRKWSSCDPFALFDAQVLTYVDSKLKKVEQNLQSEARHADLLMIWTDCDREGEHIGSEVVAVCKRVNRGLAVKRARFSAIIAAQIHQACRQANDLDMRQADAVEARISLDLRIGAAFTRLTTMGLQVRVPELAEKVVSYGPCQFPTLGFVVDQYNRVQSFVPELFWYIYVAIRRQDEDGEVQLVDLKWRRNHLFDQDFAAVLCEQCQNNPQATVTKVETKPTTKWKPLPLTTVELQQSGSRLLRLAPKRVLDIAEKLYQKGILSYPRTETDQYDPQFDFNSLIQKQTHDNQWGQYAQKLLDGSFQKPRNGKKNDKAHPPIHPTAHAGQLEGDERRVFELVTRRFLASCSANAEGNTTTVEIVIADEMFSTSGLVITRRNYLEVYPYDKWSSNALPDFQVGETFIPDVVDLKEGSTSRPNLLTEADLVGLMDKNGIGTDATIAEHIAKIIEREYVTEKQDQKIKYLVPSTLGVGLVEGFNRIGFDRSLSKPHLRRETEYRMQLICDGIRRKGEILEQTIDEYKEVFIKARREFPMIIESVIDYLHGAGEAQEALRAATRVARGRGRGGAARGAARGARGGRGGGAGGLSRGRTSNDDDDEEDDDEGPAPPRGGNRSGATRGRGISTREAAAAGQRRGRGSSSSAAQSNGRKRSPSNDDETFSVIHRRGGGGGASNGEAQTCDCGQGAVSRTVTRSDSAHQGRMFWTCPKSQGEQCGYFQWAGDNDQEPQAGRSRYTGQVPLPAKRQRTTSCDAMRADDGDEVRCDCELEATYGTVMKDGANKGRQFWACPNNPKARCGFFKWADEMDGDDGDGMRAPSRAGPSGGGSAPTGECYKCGEAGHWANVCPNEAGPSSRAGLSRTRSAGGGTSGGATGSCFKCGEEGHWSNACPNDDGGGPSRGASSKSARGGGGGDLTGECYKCHETGHWANTCPNDGLGGPGLGGGRGGGSGGGGGGGSNTSGECFKCNRTGHWASDCPNGDNGGGGGGGARRNGSGGRGSRGGAKRASGKTRGRGR
ncbi:hypothetical protein IAR55_005245 [Kwoniella newhampshirensis]|uniref:DNA topoisomerase n=1 Tax=Kwoniella newhampshirensis TaxID=1651941 RepID=A0AAW0YV70_9TREE